MAAGFNTNILTISTPTDGNDGNEVGCIIVRIIFILSQSSLPTVTIAEIMFLRQLETVFLFSTVAHALVLSDCEPAVTCLRLADGLRGGGKGHDVATCLMQCPV